MLTLTDNSSVIPQDGKKRLLINTETGAISYSEGDGTPVLGLGGEEVYSAFEVYAHDTDIPAGALAAPHSQFIGRTGDEIVRKVTASMTETFSVRSLTPPDKQDVVVDWGDGETTALSTVTPAVSGTEYRYTVSHTYSVAGTYIVKILGRTYFSFMGSNDPSTTLISRIFEDDLPVAPWIWNFSSVCLHAQRLLHVDIYNHIVAITGLHWSRAFTSALNLIDVSGFTSYNAARNSNYNCFQNCLNLAYSDFRLAAAPPDVNGGNGYAYAKCYKLAVDVEDLLPAQGFKPGSTINLAEAFRAGYLLLMSDPDSVAKKLWMNPDVTFVNTDKTFELCSDAIRANIPVSWGGSNAMLDYKKEVAGKTDYTAFEVYAHDTEIPVGESAELGGTVTTAIAPGMIEEFVVCQRTAQYDDNDVIIDWGDGTFDKLRETISESFNETYGEYQYTCTHEYTTVGKYVVKVYGSAYYRILTSGTVERNLVCRVFDKDLPIASHIRHFPSFLKACNLLLRVDISNSNLEKQAVTITQIFNSCKNLLEVTGFYNKNNISTCNNAFAGCSALRYCGFKIPALLTGAGAKSVFHNCKNLSMVDADGNAGDILNLLPVADFTPGQTIYVEKWFTACKSLTCSDIDSLAKKLWLNKSVNWVFPVAKYLPFADCSNELRAQIPASWGGTAEEPAVTDGLEERIAKLEEQLNGLYITTV